MRVVLAVLIAAALPPHAHVDGRWPLGGGYAAMVFDDSSRAGHDPLWTFEVVKRSRVVVRHREFNGNMSVEDPRDITGDGVREVIVHTINDGTAGGGTWRVYSATLGRELWVQAGYEDTKRVELLGRTVQTWRAIFSSQTKATRGGIHCCWRLWWHTTWRWQSNRFTHSRPVITDRPPPPKY